MDDLPRRPKVRDVIRALTRAGARPLRISGSHEVWELPSGQRFPIVVNHRNAEVGREVLASVRRAIRPRSSPGRPGRR